MVRFGSAKMGEGKRRPWRHVRKTLFVLDVWKSVVVLGVGKTVFVLDVRKTVLVLNVRLAFFKF